MVVVLGSIFRNSVGYLGTYLAQANALARALRARGDVLAPVLVEGDSRDQTWDLLRACASSLFGNRTCVVKREHGGPEFGSVDDPVRWRQLAYACNGVLESLPPDTDAVIYVEADLQWEVATILALLDRLRDVPAVAPMCFRGGLFYDVYGHRKDGMCFMSTPPYHPGIVGKDIVEIDSAGSCIVMRGEVARRVRFSPVDCPVGLGRSIRENGYSLWLVPTLRVTHP